MIKPYYQEPMAMLYNGQVMNVLQDLSDDSVQCMITSPPYWGLRKYDGEQDWVWGGKSDCEHQWDSVLSSHHKGQVPDNKWGNQNAVAEAGNAKQGDVCAKCGAWKGALGLEPTITLYIQHSVEILHEIKRVLRPDGIVWWNVGDSYAGSWGDSGHRPERDGVNGIQREKKTKFFNREGHPRDNKPVTANPGGCLKPKDLCLIPERLAIALQQDGWWIRSRIVWAKANPMPESVKDRPTNAHETIWMLTKNQHYYFDMEAVREPCDYPKEGKWSQVDNKGYHNNQDMKARKLQEFVNSDTRNIRDVWEINTQPFKDAHFAVFPEDIPRKCILASTKQGDVVLDPFGGSGTTSKVSKELNRRSIYIDVSEKYCEMAKKRISNVPLPMELGL